MDRRSTKVSVDQLNSSFSVTHSTHSGNIDGQGGQSSENVRSVEVDGAGQPMNYNSDGLIVLDNGEKEPNVGHDTENTPSMVTNEGKRSKQKDKMKTGGQQGSTSNGLSTSSKKRNSSEPDGFSGQPGPSTRKKQKRSGASSIFFTGTCYIEGHPTEPPLSPCDIQ